MGRPSKTEVEETSQETIAASTAITLTAEQLQQLLANAGSQKTDDKFSQLVSAIIESRKPYVDPKDEANDEAFRVASRQQEEDKRRSREASQSGCPHEKGANGNRSFGESAFWVHRLDTGETIGICSQCGKEISSLNPEDMMFFRKRGDNLPSQAGQRTFLNPVRAMAARLTPEERKRVEQRILATAS